MSRSRSDRSGWARRKLTRRLRALGNPCGICHRPIDYSLPPGDPYSFEADEIVPVSRGGSELDWDNMQASHRVCNRLKGGRVGFALPFLPARDETAKSLDAKLKAFESGEKPKNERVEQEVSQSWL